MKLENRIRKQLASTRKEIDEIENSDLYVDYAFYYQELNTERNATNDMLRKAQITVEQDFLSIKHRELYETLKILRDTEQKLESLIEYVDIF